MEKEWEEANLSQLAEQIRAMGLPESMVADLRQKAEGNRIGDLKLFFNTQVEGLPVKGHLSLEREEAFGKLRAEYLQVDLSENPNAKHRLQFFDPNAPEKVTLREAVNLMEGRSVYRANPLDSTKGFWISLDPAAIHQPAKEPDILASNFQPLKAIRDSQLGRWLDAAAQIVLAEQLRWGERVPVQLGAPGRERSIYVEADARAGRLRVTDGSRKAMGWSEVERALGPELPTVRQGRRR